MAELTVTTLIDEIASTTNLAAETADGTGLSLREAVSVANATAEKDEILFSPLLLGGTILLTQGEIEITQNLTIDGDFSADKDNKADITISGGDASRVFKVAAGELLSAREAEFVSLTISDGDAGNDSGGRGGGILAEDDTLVRLIHTTLTENHATHGGGIASSGELDVISSTISDNVADIAGDSTEPRGGGIYAHGDSVISLVNATISGNSAKSYGGGVSGFGYSKIFVHNSTITKNSAYSGGGIYNAYTTNTTNSVVSGNYGMGLHPDFSAISKSGTVAPFSRLDAISSFFGSDVYAANIVTLAYSTYSANPMPGSAGLYALADNGGPVRTHGLAPMSPLIDAGQDFLIGSDRFDLDGDGDTAEPLSRDANSTPRLSGTVDIGAVELQGPNLPPVAFDVFAVTERFVPVVSQSVIGGVIDPEGDNFEVTDVSVPPGGRAFINDDGTISYAPRPDFVGNDVIVFTITDERGAEVDTNFEVEVVSIAERIVCARIVAYLYEASLDRFPDLPGVNFWIDAALGELPGQAAPLSKLEIAQFFLDSAEFETLIGDDVDNLTDQELVERLFLNTLDRAGEPAGVNFWTGVLADPGFSRADLLLAFAQSPENQLGSPDIATLEETTPGEWEFVV